LFLLEATEHTEGREEGIRIHRPRSDVLLHHRYAIDSALFSRIESRFALSATVTLYDLTNPDFGSAA
jgi:hypothetical protein